MLGALLFNLFFVTRLLTPSVPECLLYQAQHQTLSVLIFTVSLMWGPCKRLEWGPRAYHKIHLFSVFVE